MDKIELINDIPELEDKYKERVKYFIISGLITLDEWNTRFKSYRDNYGYSIIHYLECVFNDINIFVTVNPIMLKNKKDLEKRFKVKVMTPKEFGERIKN